jgi:UDP-glucose 4-epimerase
MKVIVTGGLGYVGGRLSRFLARVGHEVIAVSRRAAEFKTLIDPGIVLLTPEEVRTDAVMGGADAIVHLAAMNEKECIQFPYSAVDVNITETVKWLELSVRYEVKKFIYFSTAHVYKRPLIGDFSEDSPAVPVHPYAITHKCAEDYVLAYHIERRMQNVIFRLTNSFGGAAYPTIGESSLLVNDLCRTIVSDSTMTLLSDGQQSRDFICLEDVCSAVEFYLDSDKEMPGVVNLSSGKSITVWEMALNIKAVAEKYLDKPIKLTRKEPLHRIQQPLSISNEKLKKAGFVPTNPVDEEIISTINFYQAHLWKA